MKPCDLRWRGSCAAALVASTLIFTGPAQAAFSSSSDLRPLWHEPDAVWGSNSRAKLATRLASSNGSAFNFVSTAASPPLSAAAQIGLWRFVTAVKAQQAGGQFELLQTNLRVVDFQAAPNAAVPLPGAFWMFGLGLVGLAATRSKRKKAQAGDNCAALAAA